MRLRYAAGAVLALTLAACTSSPDQMPGLAVPSMDGGVEISTGNSAQQSFLMPPPPVASVPAAPPNTTTTTTAPPAPPPNNAPPVNNQPRPGPQAQPNATGRFLLFSARDNEPRGSRDIAYPNVLHGQAGGSGTFGDPITFATRQNAMRPGTRIYVPDFKRYFILEDVCGDCGSGDLKLWAGATTDSGVSSCEQSLQRTAPYQVNPPDGLPIVTGDLYQNGRCYRP